MKRAYFRLILGTVIVLGLATLSWAVQAGSGDEFHWTGKLAADKVLAIANVNGSIAADGSSSDQIEVTATKTGPDRERVKIEMANTPDGLMFCAVYPGDKCGEGWRGHSENVHAKVDFTVRLPRNLRFKGQTVNGAVRADGLGRPATATSVNGPVDVSTSSWAKASSVNGAVRVRMGSTDWTGTLKVSSVNGSVELDLPPEASTDVEFSTVNGRLTSDFPITTTGSSFFGHGPKSMEGRLGNGGRQLKVDTVNGSLTIRKGSAL